MELRIVLGLAKEQHDPSLCEYYDDMIPVDGFAGAEQCRICAAIEKVERQLDKGAVLYVP